MMTRVLRDSIVGLLCIQHAAGFVSVGNRRQTMAHQPLLFSAVTASAPSSEQQQQQQSPPPMAPLTLWGEPIQDIRALQKQMKEQTLPEFGIEISASKDLKLNNLEDEMTYFQQNANQIKRMMQDHGAIIFRDFQLMKTQDGFQTFYQNVGMKPCLDPLHSVSARPTLDGNKNSAVYEAVNKESRKNFFIGMHNEFVGTRAPRAAAFGCFKAAEIGGEFIIADGRQIFRQLNPDILHDLYTKQIRYSVMELPFFDWLMNIPTPFQRPLEGMIQSLVSTIINAKVDFNVDLTWQEDGQYETNSKFLQARAPRQPPVVIHPVTKDPTWFCNVHSHSSKLRRDREEM
jgi:Taurine catabolism dioxygenase TauD, TfdA family